MRELTEIRWHARAGQGAKTAAQVLALSLLHSGKSVQAFPEYGPERRGAPLRAFTRVSNMPIRRHDTITNPDLVVVLEPSLIHEADVAEGLSEHGLVLLNAESEPVELAGIATRCVPATRIAADQGSGFVNLIMLGAAAAALREPPLEDVQEAAVETLGRKLAPDSIRAAVAEGHACLS